MEDGLVWQLILHNIFYGLPKTILETISKTTTTFPSLITSFFLIITTSFLFNNNLLSLYLFHFSCAPMSMPITFAINTDKPNKIRPS